MPTELLFIHSAGAQSGEQGSAPFAQALRQSLGPAYQVLNPLMPAPDKPSYERWKHKLETLLPAGRPWPLLVGHSLGGSVLLKYLSEQAQEVRAAGLFIVASPYWGSDGWTVDEFVLREGFARLLPPELKVYLYQSRDDEVVDIAHLSRYADAVPQATVRRLEGHGHTFQHGLPELVQDIRGLCEPEP
jgi:uncharacterized protein